MDELVSNFAHPLVGLLAAAIGLLHARHIRRQAERRRQSGAHAPRPAE
jgi:hypothetical protein